MIFGAPETLQFLALLQRLKQAQDRRQQQTRAAMQRARAVLRKLKA